MSKNIFYNLDPSKKICFSSYLSSLLYLKEMTNKPITQANFFIMISDLEALHLNDDKSDVCKNIFDNISCLLASGINYLSKNIYIFKQSDVPAHINLTWYLSYTKLYDIRRLMDVSNFLLYNPDIIIADTKDISSYKNAIDVILQFNTQFEAKINTPTLYLHNLNRSCGNRIVDNMFDILLIDNNDEIVKKIKESDLDDFDINYDIENNPVISKLIDVISKLSSIAIEDVVIEHGGKGMSNLKSVLTDLIIKEIEPIRSIINKVSNNKFYVSNIINNGNTRANFIANGSLEKVKSILNL